MRRMLNLDGVSNVTIANDGHQAVEKVQQKIAENSFYDIIFMDVQMPNMDGRQATEIIRGELKYEYPIIAVSAYADLSNVNDCKAVGMNFFLAKPLRRPQLRQVLYDYGVIIKPPKGRKTLPPLPGKASLNK
ncbi:complex between Ypd1 and Sln1 response regulator domain in space group P2(1)2(1)2(1) [Nadsonia fulvescens var. elongata DSM 6958]|uniref:Complex between Ypd1 and Sln1 response regulator domain in space group P2(1)2(1)2(1) n=1 Tax=Nadsonia fulvescens var. elongata DSM 6958 TaxID=857566 RepID=A0A1E3PLK2_9ASCO|nr:complex between Ypd1 and Sln1 response regulator domain in space group P2(1)2(1)2(1) [Nadsonia fulvescens var. elongata DSM 6958]